MPASKSKTLDYAFVLHKRAFSETSLIVELFVRDVGRTTVIAKGARRKKSQFSGLLEPFNQIHVKWTGRSEMGTLTLAERCNEPVRLASQQLFCGMYLNELLINLLEPNDPYPALYDEYQSCLDSLQNQQQLESILRQFELTLLEQIGYGLQLECDAQDGEPIVADRSYRFQIDHGLMTVLTTNQSTISGATLIALNQGQALTLQQRREAKQLLRRVIDYHLNGKPLRSRDLFRTIQSSQHKLD
jgi:DNA repair protein RecO (recombination protein O)